MVEIAYLVFHDAINQQSANRFMVFCSNVIQTHQPNQLYFLFSSNGGAVDSGVTLYNFLRGLPQDITMHNIGSIDSIANAVFLGASKRYATPASAFLLHGVAWNFAQGASLTYTQMQESVSRFDSAEQLSAQIIGERTTLTPEEVRGLFRQGESKSPAFALEKKLIHEIKDVSIVRGAPLFTIA